MTDESPKRGRITSPPATLTRARILIVALAAVVAAALAFVLIRSAPERAERRLQAASLPELERATLLEPTSPRAFYHLGLRLQEAGQTPQALRAYWRTVQLAPETEEAWRRWGPLAAQEIGAQEAHTALEGFLEEHPDSAQGHLMIATLLLRSGYYASAYTHAQAAAKADPRKATAWQVMGMAALTEDRYAEAESAYRRALALAPGDADSQMGLGDALFEMRRSPEALAAYREAARLAPDRAATANLNIGKALLLSAAAPAAFAEARRHLLLALDLKAALPEAARPSALLYMGQSYARASEWEPARRWLEEAERSVPGDAGVQYELIGVYRRLNDAAGSARARQKHRMIEAYRSQGRVLTERIASHPDDLTARLKLARLHAANGSLVDAVKAYRFLLLKAPEMQPARREYEALAARIGPK